MECSTNGYVQENMNGRYIYTAMRQRGLRGMLRMILI